MLFHPFTGQVIDPDDLPALEDAEAELTTYLSGFGVFYGIRRELRGAVAAKRKAANLPPPRFRTETQQKVSECPRCGGRHSGQQPEGAPASEGAGPGAEPSPFHDGE